MITRSAPMALLFMLAFAASPAGACLWDRDTLQDEERGLPGVSEIIVGMWERHAPAYYQHRVEAATRRLADHPQDLAAWDDLAVAYEKLGQRERAIETILKKDALAPGQYTTHANLGTFYLHGGDLEKGIEQIRRALQINPDAHFGREEYQLQIAEYLQKAKAEPETLELSFVTPLILKAQSASRIEGLTDPDAMEEIRTLSRLSSDRPEFDKAITGVIGMIRFGTGTSSHLYFALGDLLAARGDRNLAYRAYTRALECDPPNPEVVKQAREQVRQANDDADDIDAQYVLDRRAADQWVAAWQAHEAALLAAGRDPDDAGAREAFYAEHGSPREQFARPWFSLSRDALYIAGAGALILLIALRRPALRWLRNRSEPALPPTTDSDRRPG